MGGFVVSYKEKKSYSEIQKEKAISLISKNQKNGKIKRGVTKSKSKRKR